MNSTLTRYIYLSYSLACYGIATAALTYLGFFLANILVPVTVDGVETGSLTIAILTNLALVTLFGLQHSIMARASFKNALFKVVPEPIERSTYVLAVAAVFIILFLAWQPINLVIWQIESPWGVNLMWVLYFIGWILTFASTFMHNHFDLMGVRQAWRYFLGKPAKQAPFRERSLYKFIRHPMMLGLLIVFWATPQMTLGHLLFSAGMTAYIFIGVAFEERDLLKAYGESYAKFRDSHPMLIPDFRSLLRGTSHPRN